ncbi:MAG: hypothetical protein RJB39_793 [Candidatus Parcubacteria bacterium]|jgi:putative membrane protein
MKKYDLFLVAALIGVWTWASINPHDPIDWFMENVLVLAGVITALFSFKYFKLSRLSYSLVTIYLILHIIGSHYSYSEVPFGYTLQEWVGGSRNMYDRLIHFSYGLLLSYPTMDVFKKVSKARGFLSYYIPIEMTLAVSALYEIAEWITAIFIHQTAGVAFIGAQGDMWDAQKDMLLAGIGAVIAMTVLYLFRRIRRTHKSIDLEI